MGDRIKPSNIPNISKSGTQPKFNFVIPEGMVLIIDSAEHDDPLFKKPPRNLAIMWKHLITGDYSVKGFEDNGIIIERKKILDLFNCLGNDRDRFQAELKRMENFERKWIVVEAPEEEVLSYQMWSKMNPNSVRGSICSIEIRYNVPFYYAYNRESAERWVLDRLIKYFKVKREG